MVTLLAALVFYAVLLITTCVYAIWKGGHDERAAGVALLAAAAATQIGSIAVPRWEGPEYGLILVDILFFLILLAIAHRSASFWPLWAASAQLVGTLTHLIVLMEGTIIAQVYATAQPFWAFPLLIALGIGTWGRHHASMQ